MNKFELNREEELINRLLDRDLSSAEKSELLEELSHYPESKNTLAEYEEIQSAIKSDKLVLLPPEDYNRAVFSEIGKLAESLHPKSFFAKNKYALLGLLLLLVGFTGYFAKDWFKSAQNPAESSKIEQTNHSLSGNDFAKSGSESVTSANKSEIIDKIPTTSNSNVSENSIKLNSGNERKIKLNNKSTASEVRISENKPLKSEKNSKSLVSNSVQNTELQNKNSNSVQGSNNIQNSNTIQTSNTESLNTLDPRFNSIINSSNINKYSGSGIIPFSTEQNKFTRSLFNSDKSINWLLQYRGLYAVSSPEKNLQGRNFYFNSYCFGGFLEAYDGIYLGAEFGAEPYSQIYLDPNTDIQFEQTPSIFFFGVAGKFEFKNWSLLGVHPAVQAFAGSSSLGPLLRTNLTLQYDFYGNVGFFFGGEGGIVLYSNNGVWYNSKKLGLIGGFNIRL